MEKAELITAAKRIASALGTLTSVEPHISTIDLKPYPSDFRLEFMVDGKPLMEIFPLNELTDPEMRKILESSNSARKDELYQKYVNLARTHLCPRLGKGSPDWQISALDQLLLRAPPELSDGRRSLYVCGGDCECEHIGCVIQNLDGLFIWRDFVRGYPAKRQAESFESNTWKRIDFVPNPSPRSSPLTAGPFFFEEAAYKALFELEYAKLAAWEEKLKEAAAVKESNPQAQP